MKNGFAPAIVLVHGLWHGAWSWAAVRAALAADGIESAAVELPLTSLADDVAATRELLDSFDRPIVLAGHSYGGAVITEAGAHPRVRHLAYFAAFQLDSGESVSRTLPSLDIPATQLGAALRFSADGGEVSLDPSGAAELMYQDAPKDVTVAAIAQLRPARRAVFSGSPQTIAWRDKPSTYVVCSQDLAVHPRLQQAMAQRATKVHTWPVGHSPAATRPGEVAALLASIAGSIGGPAPAS